MCTCKSLTRVYGSDSDLCVWQALDLQAPECVPLHRATVCIWFPGPRVYVSDSDKCVPQPCRTNNLFIVHPPERGACGHTLSGRWPLSILASTYQSDEAARLGCVRINRL